MASEPLNKHQQMARTGHAEGYAGGGHVETKKMKSHGVGHKHGGSIHNVTSQSGESTSSWDTDSVGTSGAKKDLHGGGTGGTRNRV